MRPVRFVRAARRDLENIYRYIAADSTDERAQAYIDRIVDWCESLNKFPERGADYSDTRPGMRVAGFERRVSIAFAVKPSEVAILRVLYGGQDVERAIGRLRKF